MFEDIRPVIEENIKKAIEANTFNVKVMPGDYKVSPEDRNRVVFKYDINKTKFVNKVGRYFAMRIVNQKTTQLSKFITINGLENAIELKGKSCIITSNHFSPFDSLVVRYLSDKLGFKNRLSIVINEGNLFMAGSLGKLIRNIDVMPYSHDLSYLATKFNPSFERRIKRSQAILIYPEQEMWLDYPYARPLMPGAYHFATKYNVPILPVFTTWERDASGNTHYTINVGTPLYPDPKSNFFENKKMLNELDYAFKSGISKIKRL